MRSNPDAQADQALFKTKVASCPELARLLELRAMDRDLRSLAEVTLKIALYCKRRGLDVAAAQYFTFARAHAVLAVEVDGRDEVKAWEEVFQEQVTEILVPLAEDYPENLIEHHLE